MELNESARVPEVIRYIKGLEARVEELEAAGDPSVPEEYPDAGAETPVQVEYRETVVGAPEVAGWTHDHTLERFTYTDPTTQMVRHYMRDDLPEDVRAAYGV
jgi:hypothetical protein